MIVPLVSVQWRYQNPAVATQPNMHSNSYVIMKRMTKEEENVHSTCAKDLATVQLLGTFMPPNNQDGITGMGVA